MQQSVARPELEEIEAFLRVAEAGSLTAAAHRLDVPKSTLSRRLSRLEEALGAQLLVRSTRQLRLTEVGAAYLERVGPAVERIDEAGHDLQGDRDTPRGHLRITAPIDLANTWLPPLVATFRQRHPAVTMEVLVETRRTDLIREGIDLALRAATELSDSGLVARRIASDELAFWASQRYLKKHGTPRTVSELLRHPISAMSQRGRLVGPDGASQADLRIVLRSNDPLFLRSVALHDAGIVLLPSIFAHAARSLSRVLPGWHMGKAGLYLVHPAARVVPAKVRVFRDFLAAHAPDSPAYRSLERKLSRRAATKALPVVSP